MSDPTPHRALMNYTLDRISKGDQRGINVSAAHYAWLGNALAWNEREKDDLREALLEVAQRCDTCGYTGMANFARAQLERAEERNAT